MSEAALALDLRPVDSGELLPLARIYGETLFELPHDLYIPPEALQVMLEAFQGPLDLLLYLIRKANIDVLDIPMAALTAQYLQYVEAMRSHNLELAAEYLLIAAVLLEIKSRMLLPRPAKAADEEADPRADLVRRLLQYEQIKLAALRLDALPRLERDFSWVSVWVAEQVVERQPEVSLHDLQAAWLGLMKKASLSQHHTIKREELSVREHMSRILRALSGQGFRPFLDLFDASSGLPYLVVSFLAVLELVKERLVVVSQVEPMEPIYVRIFEPTE